MKKQNERSIEKRTEEHMLQQNKRNGARNEIMNLKRRFRTIEQGKKDREQWEINTNERKKRRKETGKKGGKENNIS